MHPWYQAKVFLEHALGISMDALHVILGVLLQLVLALAFRTTVASWKPWIALLLLLAGNELSDLYVEQWPSRPMQFGESVKDLLLTMLLPTVLLAAARLRSALFAGGSATIEQAAVAAGQESTSTS